MPSPRIKKMLSDVCKDHYLTHKKQNRRIDSPEAEAELRKRSKRKFRSKNPPKPG